MSTCVNIIKHNVDHNFNTKVVSVSPRLINSALTAKIYQNLALLDSGSSHVLLHPQPIKAVKPTIHSPLEVMYGGGTKAKSIASGILSTKNVSLPVSIYKEKDLMHQLLGCAPFTKNGCEVKLTNTEAVITKGGEIILKGSKKPSENLWSVDLDKLPPSLAPLAEVKGVGQIKGEANLALRLQSVQEEVNYLQCLLGNRPIDTVTEALRLEYIRSPEGWPVVSHSQFRAHAINVPAIAAGHLQEHRKNVASTRPQEHPTKTDITPEAERPFVWIEHINNAVHADAKGPLQDIGYIMHFVYNNYHHMEICSDPNGASAADAYLRGILFFATKGHLVQWIRIDNVGSQHLTKMLATRSHQGQPLKLDFVNVGDHRRNKAEKGIQLAQRAFLSTLATVPASFPIEHRRLLLPQVEITLNHLVPWATNHAVSAYHGLFGHRYDFNACPFTIAGCLVSRHLDSAKKQPKGSPKAALGHAIGPAPDHYRNFKILVPISVASNGTIRYQVQIENQLDFHLPSDIKLPRLSYHAEVSAAIKDLIAVLKHQVLLPSSTPSPMPDDLQHLGHQYLEAARQAHRIFGTPAPALLPRPPGAQLIHHHYPILLPPPGFAPLPVLPPPLVDPAPLPLLPPPPPGPDGPGTGGGGDGPGGGPVGNPIPVGNIPLPAQDQGQAPPAPVPAPPVPAAPIPAMAPVPQGATRFSSRNRGIPPEHGPLGGCAILKLSPKAFALAVDAIVKPFNKGKVKFKFEVDRIVDKVSRDAALNHEEQKYWDTKILPDIIVQGLAEDQATACAAIKRLLNTNADGSPLTRKSARSGVDKPLWDASGIRELTKLFDTKTFKGASVARARSLSKSPTYYNPVLKEKYKFDLGPNNDPRLEQRTRGSVGGNLLFPTGNCSTNTAETTVIKTFLNAVVSSGDDLVTMDIRDFYLGTDLPPGQEEFVWIDDSHFDEAFLTKYKLHEFVVTHNGKRRLLVEICKTIYGLKQSGALSKAKLDGILNKGGYFEDKIVPCIYKHVSSSVQFCLVVDDFAVRFKNMNRSDLDHLVATIRNGGYDLSVDYKALKFVGMDIEYNKKEKWLEISCKGYVQKLLHRFRHCNIKPEQSPMVYVPPNYGAKIQLSLDDTSTNMSPAQILECQQQIGCVLWLSRMIDSPTLTGISKCASELSAGKVSLIPKLHRVLGHLMAFPDNRVRYYASDMVFRTFSDASYLTELRGRSRIGVYGYFGWADDPHRLNGPVLADSTILDVVVGSVAEAEYGGAYKAGRTISWVRTIAAVVNYPQQGPTDLFVDNTTAVGLANDTLKIARTKAIDMRFHWLRDRVRQGQIKVRFIPGAQQLADFFTKPLSVKEHLRMMTKYVRTPQRSYRNVHFNVRQ